MMFKEVQNCIDNLPCISFEQYFTHYVFDIQDMNIAEEVKFMVNNNFLDSKTLDRIVKQEEERLSW